MAVVVRKAAWSSAVPEDGWSEDLRWYAAAIHQMKLLTPDLDEYRGLWVRLDRLSGVPGQAAAAERAALVGALGEIISGWADPGSLGYQAQVHATYLVPDTAWPRYRDKPVLWHECAHGNWFFLPWHRAYLVEFESVVRGHIERLGGPHETWALPYWNSSDYLTLPEAAGLPLALATALIPEDVQVEGIEGPPDRRANPLFEPTRTGPGPLRGRRSSADWPDASAALQRKHYANAEGRNAVSFAGGYLEDLTRFHSAQELGQIDLQPHGAGHVETGGFMSGFTTAGLDPVFWMHHANVDRLWETYARDLGHGYPFPDGQPAGRIGRAAFASWTKHEFTFLRPDATLGTWVSSGVIDVEKLGYRYDTTAPPRFNSVGLPPAGADIEPFGLAGADFTPVAAASDLRIADAATVVLTGGDGADGTGLVDPSARWSIRFDGIRCQRPAATSYAVYVDLPDEDDVDDDRLLGILSLFGVFESSAAVDGDRGSSRLFDATAVVRGVAGFDPFAARLTLIPTGTADRERVGLTVERISLEVG